MASSILGIAKKLRNLTTNTASVSLRKSLSTTTSTSERKRTPIPSRENLFERISHLGHPSISLVPVLDQWAQEFKDISQKSLRDVVYSLRKNRRYTHALQVSEWMNNKGLCEFTASDHAVCLDLIGKVRGIESAEIYFNSLSGLQEDAKLHGALLNCYIRECLIDKSLSHFQNMRRLGVANTSTYNAIMRLHKNTNQLAKIPGVLSEMMKDGFVPDNFTYRLCINECGLRSDLPGLEAVLKEIETQPHVVKDWATYAMVANFYIKTGDHTNSLIYLEKCEELVGKDSLGYNHLISFHASLGHKGEVVRLWGLQRIICKRLVNRDYKTVLGSLVKLGELEEAEKLLEEWESSCRFHDIRVPNTLLAGYCQNGLTKKAESKLREMVANGKTPIPDSWEIVANGYLDSKNMDKAFDCLKEALAVRKENIEWWPKPGMIMEIMNWAVDVRDVEEVEAFVSLIKDAISGNGPIYRELTLMGFW